MTNLQHSLARFRRRVIYRLAGYSALLGLIVALVIVIAAPWLRDAIGLPGYWVTLALPLALPLFYMIFSLIRGPGERTVVLAADAWCRAEGSIISAWELEKEHPDSPFTAPVAAKAVALLKQHRLPEPVFLRKLMVAMLVMLALVPLSRYVHAQMEDAENEEKREELEKLTDVKPEDAAEVAKDAGTAAEKAKEIEATEQEKLADDIEQAARNAQAGGREKEKSLREANSLVDRAKAQTEAHKQRADARESMRENRATERLADAIESADPKAVDRAVSELAEDVFKPDGGMDKDRADDLREAVEKARAKAPHDARLRRAAEAVEDMLDDSTQKNSERRRKETSERMKSEGASPEDIEKALSALNSLDKKTLKKALEELSKAASPTRDIDPSGKQQEELLRQLENGEISPEQAARMAELARELSERLELDAETLREMLKEGGEFEGLDEAAKRAMERAKENGEGASPEEIPEWVKDAVSPEMIEELAKEAAKRAGTRGNGNEEGEGKTSGGGGLGSGEGGPSEDGGDGNTPEIEGEGKEGGVDTSDTGEGEKDPDANEETLDPNKAGEEDAKRGTTGRDSTSSGINTRDEEERLPRRFRDAARKYFERK